MSKDSAPSYSATVSSLTRQDYEDAVASEGLPAYPDDGVPSSALDDTAYKRFEISNGDGSDKAVSFTLLANKQFSTQTLPIVLEGQPLKGILALRLASPSPIRSIDLTVEGKYLLGGITGLEKTTVFLDHHVKIWSQADGEPSQSLSNSTIESPGSPFTGSLRGDYTWLVSINLPEKVPLILHGETEPRLFNLPQSFNERFIRATVSYTLSVKITRYGFLKNNYLLMQPFNYLRVTRPPPFPILRQVAYQERTPILGPLIDKDGWYSKDPVQIEGKLFKAVDFTAQCTLYLAKPLSYTAGTVVPLCIKIDSSDQQALDFLATPQAVHVRIRRQIIDHSQRDNIADNGSFRESLDYSQRAVWWVAESEAAVPSQTEPINYRMLNGEIHLKPGMKPNMELGDFKLNYSVMLYDFSAVGVELGEHKFLQEIPIEICAFHAAGPRPVPVTTPKCDPDVPYGKLIVPRMDAYSKGFY